MNKVARFLFLLRFFVIIGILNLASGEAYSPLAAQEDGDPFAGLEPISSNNADQLNQLAMIGRGQPRDATISPDGRTLAIGTSAGIWFYDMDDLSAEPEYLMTGFGAVDYLQYSNDGTIIAMRGSASFGGRHARVWDLMDGISNATQLLAQQYGSVLRPNKLEDIPILSPDGSTAVVNGFLVDLASGDVLADLNITDVNVSPEGVTYSPDGSMIALLDNQYFGSDHEVHLVDTATQEIIGAIVRDDESEHQPVLLDVEFSSNGSILYMAASTENEVAVWSFDVDEILSETGISVSAADVVWESTETFEAIISLEVRTTDAALIMSVLHQEDYIHETVYYVVDAQTTTLKHRITDATLIRATNQDELYSFKTNDNGDLEVWNVGTDTLIGILIGFSGTYSTVDFNTNWSQVAIRNDFRSSSGEYFSNQSIFDLTQLIENQRIPVSPYSRSSMTFRTAGISIMTFSNSNQTYLSNQVYLIDVQSDRILLTFNLGGWQRINSFDFSNEGNLFLVIGAEPHLWDISDLEHPREINMFNVEGLKLMYAAYFTPYGQIMSYSPDGQIILWEISDGGEHPEHHTVYSESILYHFHVWLRLTTAWGNQTEMMVIYDEDHINIWSKDEQTNQWVSRVLPNSVVDPVCSIALSSDDRLLAAAECDDGDFNVYVWDVETREVVVSFPFDDYTTSMVFSRDSTLLMIADHFGELHVREVATGQELATYQVSASNIIWTTLNTDGTLLASTWDDGTLRFWGVQSTTD